MLVRWDPIREIAQMQRRFQPAFGSDDSYGAWAPAVDILEQGDDLVIRAEIPGVDRDAIDVRVEDNTLILSGERKRKECSESSQAYRLEREYGSFVRSFRLPKTVDPARISAAYKDGVLDVTLPKAETAKPRKIAIAVT